MKKIILVSLYVVVALSFAACSNDKTNVKDNTSNQTSNVEIPSPWIDFENIPDAEELAGFTIVLPSKMTDGYILKSIQAIKSESLQVIYENGKNEITIRKAKGSKDISGDYNEYSENKTLTVGNINVSIKGNDGKVNVATWVDNEYTYSVSVGSDEIGLDSTEISNMISDIH